MFASSEMRTDGRRLVDAFVDGRNDSHSRFSENVVGGGENDSYFFGYASCAVVSHRRDLLVHGRVDCLTKAITTLASLQTVT